MYDRPRQITFGWDTVDVHTADITKIVRLPKGKRGRLVDVLGEVTTTFAGASTLPIVQVGKLGALTDSAIVAPGTAAAGAAIVGSAQTAGLNGAGVDAYTKLPPVLAADTDIYITFKAATGAGAAGVADVYVVFDAFD